MSQSLKHTFVTAKADGADATLFRPSDWNAQHKVGASLTNRTGVVMVVGDVVALSTVNDESVVLADVLSSPRPFVVALETPADLAVGLFAGSGDVTVKNQGAVTRGNYLIKSATTRAVEDSGVASTEPAPYGALGVARTANVGAGTVVAAWFPTTVGPSWKKGADVASAATLVPGRDGTYFQVTGAVGITAIESRPAGTRLGFMFVGAVAITHNAVTLILIGGVNYTTVAGDFLIFVSEGGGNWRQEGVPATRVRESGGAVLTVGAIADGQSVQRTGTSLVGAAAATAVPTGAISAYGGASAPAGWLACDGVAVSRTTFVDLFTVIGTTYGVGDGATTFNTPDLRGRFPGGENPAAGPTGNARIAPNTLRGATGGERDHTLTTTEIPSHTHPITTGLAGAPNTGVGTGDTTGSLATGATGGGVAHNTLPPFQIVNYIIKT